MSGSPGGSANSIHETAYISPRALLGVGNVIGPYATILGTAVLGDDNWVGPHVVLGGPPEVADHHHSADWDSMGSGGHGVVVGDRNVFHEHVTVSHGWASRTNVGSDCLLMTRAHVAHDCTLGDGVVMSAGSTLGGHVVLWTRATLGMGAVVHQRRSVGPWAMVGMAGVVTRDISACQLVMGSPARPVGLNTVGLRRAGVGEHQFARLQGWLEGTEALGQDLPVLIQRALETWMRSPDDVTTGLGARRD